MIDAYQLKRWLFKQINNEKEAIMKYSDSQILNVGICVGAHDAYAKVLDFIISNQNKENASTKAAT